MYGSETPYLSKQRSKRKWTKQHLEARRHRMEKNVKRWKEEQKDG